MLIIKVDIGRAPEVLGVLDKFIANMMCVLTSIKLDKY